VNHLVALVGIVLIGLSPIWVALAGASPATAAFFRSIYALPALTLIWFWGRQNDGRSWRARALALASGFLLAIDLTVWHQSIVYIGAGLSTILANTQVVFVAMLAWLFHREKPTKAAFQIIPMILIGAICISGLGQDSAYGVAPVAGTVLGLTSGLLYALFLLIFRASNRVLARPAGPLLDATVGASVATLALGQFDPGFSLEIVWPSHGYLLALALGSQVAGWLMITYALPRLAALETSVLMLVQPLVSLIVAALLLSERISWLQGVGIFLVVGGVAWISVKGAITPAKGEQKWISESHSSSS
jgi:drug/metabolite transporter (DMT)-like permease